MTVENQLPTQIYTANGETRYFFLTFDVEGKDNIEVYINGELISMDYYNYDNQLNAIVFHVAPQKDTEVVLKRNTSLDRSIQYTTYNNTFRPEVLNEDIDRIIRILQEQGYTDSVVMNQLAQEIYERTQQNFELKNQVENQTLDLNTIQTIQQEEINKRISGDKQVALDSRTYTDFMLTMNNTNPSIFSGIADNIVMTPTGESQRQINLKQSELNEKTITIVESISELLAIKNPKDGQVVYVKSYHKDLNQGGGQFKFNENKKLENNNGTIFNGWERTNISIIYPEFFGATPEEVNSSNSFQQALNYASSNHYILDGRMKKYNINSIVVKDNAYLKNIKLASNNFHEMNSVLITEYGMLSFLNNVTLENVEIDGMRQMHTNIDTQMDGGRSAFLVRRPIKGLKIINSKFNNAVTDGLMLFPVDWLITENDWNFFIQNVIIENSEFNGNGRWGISIDSAKNIQLIKCEMKFNGLNIESNLPYTSGKSARLTPEGLLYGGGIDIEEYHGFANSEDILIKESDLTKNAGSSMYIQRTGILKRPTKNIKIIDTKMDYGQKPESQINKSILISGYNIQNPDQAYQEIKIENTDLGGGNVLLENIQNITLNKISNIHEVEVNKSIISTDKNYNFKLNDQFSNYSFNTHYSDKTSSWFRKKWRRKLF